MHRRLLRLLLWTCLVAWVLGDVATAQAPIIYLGTKPAGTGDNSAGQHAPPPEHDSTAREERPQNEASPSEPPGEEAPRSERPARAERVRPEPPAQATARRRTPAGEPAYEQVGYASWYGAAFQGRRTASGERFDQRALTAAHPTLPIPSLVRVTNLANGREVTVRVNDRGPFSPARLIDVSRAAAEALGFANRGHAEVRVRYLGPAPQRVVADRAPGRASIRLPPVTEAREEPRPEEPRPALRVPATTSDPDGTNATEAQGDRRREEPRAALPEPAPAQASDLALAGGPDEGASGRGDRRRSGDRSSGRNSRGPGGGGGYVVQVGVYADLDNASLARAAAAAAGPVTVDVRTTQRGELFRVRVGPWASRREADAARRRLAELGYGDATVTAR